MWECRAAHQVRFPMRGLWGGLVLMGTKGHTRAGAGTAIGGGVGRSLEEGGNSWRVISRFQEERAVPCWN